MLSRGGYSSKIMINIAKPSIFLDADFIQHFETKIWFLLCWKWDWLMLFISQDVKASLIRNVITGRYFVAPGHCVQ